MEKQHKKLRRYHKRHKSPAKYKKPKKYNFYINRIVKIIFILFLSIILCLKGAKQIKSKNNNNNWIQKNKTELLNNYLTVFNGVYDKVVKNEINFLKNYLSLKVILKEGNLSLNLETKEQLRRSLKGYTGKDFGLLKNIFISKTVFFGNEIISFNNLIYYCEIFGIKNIYLNSTIDWYIKNDINTDKIHISLNSGNNINCKSYDTYCVHIYKFFYPMVIKCERRSIILKEEIKRNLPKIQVNKKDLYIYIRSGDCFQVGGNVNYPLAPYCFYQKIISNFKFNDIYLISPDDESPIIQRLLKDYPTIKHKMNPKEIDISLLMNAYNLVNAVSSFSLTAISFNDNLINLFEYEIYQLRNAIIHFHYDIDKLERTFNVYRMKPSEDYYVKMFAFENTEEQRKLLFDEKCKYDFKKTKYTKTIFD